MNQIWIATVIFLEIVRNCVSNVKFVHVIAGIVLQGSVTVSGPMTQKVKTSSMHVGWRKF